VARARRRPVRHPSPRPSLLAGEREAGVRLAWALDREGRKVRASALRPADRRARAPFSCLGCAEPLVPHLGRLRAPHFAHAPGSRCPLAAPETALHLDAKERILALAADAFAGRRRVTLLVRCPSCRRPSPRDLGALGDAADAEVQVGRLRADVLVSRAGRPALAVEVRVTHAVEPGKESALAGAGLPAVEVDARTEWERAEGDGTAIACARSLGFEPCAACAALSRAEADRSRGGEAAEVAELEAYRARGLLGLPARRGAAGEGSKGWPGSAPPGDSDAPISARERSDLARRFRCPDCRGSVGPGCSGSALASDDSGSGSALVFGERLVRHACPGGPDRPVAWRGYDGSLVEMKWWQR
jgi:hypothetical protein